MQSNRRNYLLIVLAIASLIGASVYQHFAIEQDTLTMLREGEPAVAKYEALPGDYPSYRLLDDQENLLGYGVVASASGYGGKLVVLSIVDPEGYIENIVLLDNSETPLYLNKVTESDYFASLIGRDVERDYEEVDAVTGATITSQAILNSVRKGAAQIGNALLGRSIRFEQKPQLSWWEGGAVVLLGLAIVASGRTVRKLRPWLLAASVLLIGFMLNVPLTSGNLLDLLSGNWPVFVERPFWYLLVMGILLGTLLLGRNFYCTWLCPFGAVQEGLFKSLNLVKFTPSLNVRAFIRRLRWPVLWLAAFVSILMNTPSIVEYEPFYVLFDSNGSSMQWLILIVVILMSTLQLRYWCNGFCPTGLVLDGAAKLPRAIKKVDLRNLGAILSRGNIVAAGGSVRNTILGNQDRLYALTSLAVILLILLSIVGSTWPAFQGV